MADEVDQEDRSEEASARRIQQAWDTGDIPMTRDIVSLAAMVGGLCAIIATAGTTRDLLVALLRQTMSTLDNPAFGTLGEQGRGLGRAGMTICGAAALLSLAAALAQTRAGFWPDRVLPDIERLIQPKRIFRIFTKQGLADLGISFLKVATVGVVIWLAVRRDIAAYQGLFDVPEDELLGATFHPLQSATVKVLAALAALAAIDLLLSHRRFGARMRMSKTELKQERKEEDGDPLFRSRRKRRHRQLARRRVVTEVPKADAVVVNPTHIAVAIRYRRDEGGAPRIVAKGKGQLAEVIRDLARAHGIPIVEDIALARLLYKRVKIGGQIPIETYKAVAAVLAFVYRLTGRRPGASST